MESNYFRLSEKVQNGISDKLKWNSLTQIQEETIPEILEGNNCILLAQTAGGKTEAAFLPILSIIDNEKLKPISVIYVSPIRALLNNQENRLKRLGKFIGVDAFKWHGEVDITGKRKFKIEPKHIIATTPESLEVMLMSDSYNSNEMFENIRFIVIDEIHYFADNYRGSQLASIIERIQNYSKFDIQRIGLSATIGNPDEINRWIAGSSKRKLKVIKPMSKSNKSKIFIRYIDEITPESFNELTSILRGRKSLFFANGRSNTELIARTLAYNGLNTKAHHSSISKGLREVAEDKLKLSSEEVCLCCTSTMELGIDVGKLDIVCQIGCPPSVASFRQRMGRTGRRLGTYSHYEFCPKDPIELLNSIAIVELAKEKWIEDSNTSYEAYTVLFQQLYSMIQQKFGLDIEEFKKIIKKSNAFLNISLKNVDDFLNHMLEQKYITVSKSELLPGIEFEKKFGYNFIMNFSSVFETLPEFSVIFRGREIGSLQSWFVNLIIKENENAKFTLAGTTWCIDKIDKDRGRLYVIKSPDGELTNWMGGSQLISYIVAQKMLQILNDTNNYSYIDNKAKVVLDSIRIEQSSIDVKTGQMLLLGIKDGYELITYCGHKVNFTIGLLLKNKFGCEMTLTYEKIKIKKNKHSNTMNSTSIKSYLEGLDSVNKLSVDIEEAIIKDDRLDSNSKFFNMLPKFSQVKVLKYELLDIKNTILYLKDISIIIDEWGYN